MVIEGSGEVGGWEREEEGVRALRAVERGGDFEGFRIGLVAFREACVCGRSWYVASFCFSRVF